MISLGSMADLSGVRLNSEAAKTRARTSGEAVSLPSPAFITVFSARATKTAMLRRLSCENKFVLCGVGLADVA